MGTPAEQPRVEPTVPESSGGRAPSDEKMYTTEPLEDEGGDFYRIQQQNVGPDNDLGGGEWRSPRTRPAPEAASS
jgi:hypothetical protein